MIDSKETRRAFYPPAKAGSLKKQIGHLDKHCLRFVGLSPFVVLAGGSHSPAETREQMLERYKADL